MTSDLDELQQRQAAFVAARDWQEYHRPKSLVMALSVEASELVELYQWREAAAADEVRANDELRAATRGELADVMCYALSLADTLDVDLGTAVAEKIETNRDRYPADESRSPTE